MGGANILSINASGWNRRELASGRYRAKWLWLQAFALYDNWPTD